MAATGNGETNHNFDPLYTYNHDLSNLALQNMNLVKFNELCRISEEGDALSAHSKMYSMPTAVGKNPIIKNRSDSSFQRSDQFSLMGETEAKLTPHMDTASVASEQPSIWNEDSSSITNQDLDQNFNKAMETLALQNTRQLSQKLEVKIRYLLQIFTEANCLDLSLLLSILLLDAASVSRITNSAIRSGSLAICRQLRNGLKDITRWSFQEW